MSPIREPAVAGRFYPADAAACRRLIDELTPDSVPGFETGVAGVIPHAGWIYSGTPTLRTLLALQPSRPETIVICGAVHVRDLNRASLYDCGAWRTPFGLLPVDHALAQEIAASEFVVPARDPHEHEHSIEVALPLIQHVFGDVPIVPIMIRPGPWSARVGDAIVCAVRGVGRRVIVLASTDLTHYGPSFGFEPAGRGEAGLRWSKHVNDRRFIRLIEDLAADDVVAEAAAHQNACGSGAVAATLRAAKLLGATRCDVLSHTTSLDAKPTDRGDDAVGYLSAIATTA